MLYPALLRLLRNQSLRGKVQPMRRLQRLHNLSRTLLLRAVLSYKEDEGGMVCEAELEFRADASEWKMHPISEDNVKRMEGVNDPED